MERIKKYNQFVLAIGGTVAVLLLIGFGIFALTEMFGFGRSAPSDYEVGILAQEQVDSLQADSLRQQTISFDDLRLIDSVNGVYLLPVSQVNLDGAEVSSDLLHLRDPAFRPKRIRYKHGTVYNNLVLYFSAVDSSVAVFEERIGISDYSLVEDKAGSYLLIRGAQVDTNEDGYVDGYDLQRLYVYDIRRQRLDAVAQAENLSCLDSAPSRRSGDLILPFGLDRNEDGEFQPQFEPQLYCRLDIATKELRPLVGVPEVNRLQRVLEGG